MLVCASVLSICGPYSKLNMMAFFYYYVVYFFKIKIKVTLTLAVDLKKMEKKNNFPPFSFTHLAA